MEGSKGRSKRFEREGQIFEGLKNRRVEGSKGRSQRVEGSKGQRFEGLKDRRAEGSKGRRVKG